jgi:tRNA-Thr(GGU) m(6)t(6)A37 methyltransferase TsaA
VGNYSVNSTFEPIGIVQSCFPDKFGTPRQPGLVKEALAKIQIYPSFQPADSLSGLEKFSHLWVLFLFHQNNAARFHAKVHPPRLGGESVGVFASRSPHRPNPIGLSLVEIVEVCADGVIVRGVDIISGTPVLDLKPYLHEIESQPSAVSGWAAEIATPDRSVDWDEDCLRAVEAWSAKTARPELRALIERTLKLDPRPTVYKGFEQAESPYRSDHAVRFYEGDVHFRFLDANRIQVFKVIC